MTQSRIFAVFGWAMLILGLIFATPAGLQWYAGKAVYTNYAAAAVVGSGMVAYGLFVLLFLIGEDHTP